jgi:hypothetical protein
MPTEIAAPAEYCLLWIPHWATCMQKGEWSGWAQAIGAMLALALAIGLPARARADSRKDAQQIALWYATQTLIALDRLQKSCTYQSWADFSARREALMETARQGPGVPIALLNTQTSTGVMALRTASIEIYKLSEFHSAHGNWQHWENQLKKSYEAGREIFAKMVD